ILYLPPYSPDLTPIKESFSTRKLWIIHVFSVSDTLLTDPVDALLEATSCITAEKAHGWFKNACTCTI
ncbi:uncharacterized protein F5147DRAFT_571270, partial [Suillus discolor]